MDVQLIGHVETAVSYSYHSITKIPVKYLQKSSALLYKWSKFTKPAAANKRLQPTQVLTAPNQTSPPQDLPRANLCARREFALKDLA